VLEHLDAFEDSQDALYLLQRSFSILRATHHMRTTRMTRGARGGIRHQHPHQGRNILAMKLTEPVSKQVSLNPKLGGRADYSPSTRAHTKPIRHPFRAFDLPHPVFCLSLLPSPASASCLLSRELAPKATAEEDWDAPQGCTSHKQPHRSPSTSSIRGDGEKSRANGQSPRRSMPPTLRSAPREQIHHCAPLNTPVDTILRPKTFRAP